MCALHTMQKCAQKERRPQKTTYCRVGHEDNSACFNSLHSYIDHKGYVVKGLHFILCPEIPGEVGKDSRKFFPPN
ncbi:hypothetical protein CDL12_13769 [Handroanthus impetiginosus]|uniref:Uncharacterized protein n=1 Tax=Handroanthus impetiginosus TaxID=429701 RepID=A0A2G9H7X9_9LAMI|nr:hypothetical protein CDL12_13769 [Handroanthus impetiginosus]